MKKYRVRLRFIYSDTVEVEAENEKEAEREAIKVCDEQCECLDSADIEEITE